MSYIVAGEIIKIHNYLLKAPQLRYLTGGSLLLETFSKNIVIPLANKIDSSAKGVRSSAAGRFMIEFDDNKKAETFLKIVKFTANRLFGQGSLLVCGPLNKSNGIVKEISDKLEGMKVSGAKVSISANHSFQYVQRCSACGSWDAVKFKRFDRDEEPALLCNICYKKLEARNYEKITIEFPDGYHIKGIIIDKEANPSEVDFLQVTYALNKYEDYSDKSKDFKDMVKDTKTGYIGVFYADGNTMGELISKCDTPEKYVEFSNKITDSTEDALESAVLSASVNGKFPGKIFIKGGDDILVVLPAEQSIVFAEKFLSEASKPGTALENGICGGLVLSKPTIPFNMLFHRTEELLKSAKRQVWKRGINNKSPEEKTAIDFLLLISSLIESIDNNKERQVYLMPDEISCTSFTARPYLIKEFRELIKKISDFKRLNLPRNIFISLKDIFYPFKLIYEVNIGSQVEERRDRRVDEKGNFIDLEKLINRQITLYKTYEKDIKEFFDSKYIENNLTWRGTYKDKREKDVRRVWQADIIELVDFL
jgi:hypothetical protein